MGDKFDRYWTEAGKKQVRDDYRVGDRLLLAHIDDSHLGVAVIKPDATRLDITMFVSAALDMPVDGKLLLNPNLIDLLDKLAAIIPLPTDIDRAWRQAGKLVTYKGGVKEFWR